MEESTAGAVNELTQGVSAFYEAALTRLPALGLGLIILATLVLLAGPLSRVILRPFNYVTQSDLIRSVSRRTVSILLILLGVYVFLKLAGLTEFAVAVISGTGVIGLILGFAFRDIAENFISSLLLTVQRPFRLGDVVQINDFLGVVQKVTSRATTLVDFDGNHIQIPNATIYKGVIKNLTANPKMRGHFIIGVGYENDARVAQSLARQRLDSHPDVLDDPEPQVLIHELGSSTLNLKVYFWVNAEQISVLKMASVLMRDIVSAFTKAGISMPDDAREVIFPQGVPIIQSQSGSAPEADEPEPEKSTTPQHTGSDIHVSSGPAHDDVSSENDTIRKQAAESRDPEAGENIL
ncbi:mechanosensitive ion channel family protein [Alteromonas sp. H39]|uniref:mechanosensitive ion channel family protein n=1 Tax=Alteromonas sp. H39 TaxID=3389876 RepID=UPI0039E08BC1